MKHYQQKNFFILRLDDGEEIVSSILSFCGKKRLQGAYLSGIGACKDITIAYFDREKNEYIDKRISENCEIVSLSGFIATTNKKPHLHAHIALANQDNVVFGGHLKSAIASPTCEIFLVKSGRIKRKKDEKTGLLLIA